jgi:hypothetical protein
MEYYKALKHLEDQLKGTDLSLFEVTGVVVSDPDAFEDGKTYGFVKCEIKVDFESKVL